MDSFKFSKEQECYGCFYGCVQRFVGKIHPFLYMGTGQLNVFDCLVIWFLALIEIILRFHFQSKIKVLKRVLVMRCWILRTSRSVATNGHLFFRRPLVSSYHSFEQGTSVRRCLPATTLRSNCFMRPNLYVTRERFVSSNTSEKKPSAPLVTESNVNDFWYQAFKYSTGAIILIYGTYWGNEYAKKKYAVSEGTIQVSYVKTHGKPNLGGPFVLVDTDGKVRSQRDFLGSWCFFYFGFTNCPEICPIELNRMAKVVDGLRNRIPGVKIQPLFVSCDPMRDSLEKIQEYCADFHPDFVGMIGTPKQIDQVCKSYRIYYSLPDDEARKSGDYLIDHSIAIFLFDPQGRFVDFFGSRYNEHEILEKVEEYVRNYNADPTWTTW